LFRTKVVFPSHNDNAIGIGNFNVKIIRRLLTILIGKESKILLISETKKGTSCVPLFLSY